jgi:hypothetical protein
VVACSTRRASDQGLHRNLSELDRVWRSLDELEEDAVGVTKITTLRVPNSPMSHSSGRLIREGAFFEPFDQICTSLR